MSVGSIAASATFGFKLQYLAQAGGAGGSNGSVAIPAGVGVGDIAIYLQATQYGVTVASGSGWTAIQDPIGGSSGYYGSNGRLYTKIVDAAHLSSGLASYGLSGSDSRYDAWVVIFLRVQGGTWLYTPPSVTIYGRGASPSLVAAPADCVYGIFTCTVNTKPTPVGPAGDAGHGLALNGYSSIWLGKYDVGALGGTLFSNTDAEVCTIVLYSAVPTAGPVSFGVVDDTKSFVRGYVNSNPTSGQLNIVSGSNQSGGIVSTKVVPLVSGTLTFEGASSSADYGLFAGFTDAGTMPGGTPSMDGKFNGIAIDPWRSYCWFIQNGPGGDTPSGASNVSVGGLQTNAWNTYQLVVTVGASTIGWTIKRDGATLASGSTSKPAWANARLVLGARNGGASGTFAVRGTPTWTPA